MKQIKNSLIFMSLITAASSIQAAPVFQGRIQVGVQDYDFELANLRSTGDITTSSIQGITPQRVTTENEFLGPLSIDANYLTVDTNSQKASDTLPMLGLGGTIIFENGVFIDSYFQANVSGEQAALAENNGTQPFSLQNISSIDIERKDFALSIGKSINSFTISAGYKSGETDFDQTLTQDFRVLKRPGIDFVQSSAQTSIKLQGPFVGVAYSIPIKTATLSFNVALADLDADYSTSFSSEGIGDGEFRVDSVLSGSASGATYGIKLSGGLSEKWDYTLGADYYSYDFDVSAIVSQDRRFDSFDEIQGGHSGPVSATITEEILALRLDLKYTF